MLSAPLRLTAMTLRGFGPYVHGERLEIRPLTILCGENGSGKSTWIEMLSKLKRTVADEPAFPFCTLVDPDRAYFTYHTRNINGILLSPPGVGRPSFFLDSGDTEKIKEGRYLLCRRSDDANFGPACCLGLEIQIADPGASWSFVSGQSNAIPETLQSDRSSSAANLIWHGMPTKGTRIKLRWAYPDTRFAHETNLPLDGLMDWIELTIDESYTIRLSAELGGESRSGVNYKFEASSLFISGPSSRDSQIEVLGTYDRPSVTSVSMAGLSEGTANALAANFIQLFRELTRHVLDGFFHVGAIRRLQKREDTDELDLQNPRYVGIEGEHSQTVHAYWAHSLMRQPTEPFTGGIASEFTIDDFDQPTHPIVVTPPIPAATRLRNSSPLYEAICAIADPHLVDQLSNDDDETAINLLNSVLSSRSLFPSKFLLAANDNIELGKIVGLLGDNLPLLTDDEIRRANRLMIEDLVLCWHRTGFLVETFIDYWLHKFTGAKMGYGRYGRYEGPTLGTYWTDNMRPPNGGPVDKEPQEYKRGRGGLRQGADEHKEEIGGNVDSTDTVTSPTIGDSGGWHVMSCGFHQLAPIVIQAALLSQNEIMAIENPEAHLHPSLQLEVTEFLLHQADAGKIVLIETHCDLLIRRVMRSIREEAIKQENVRIYFSHLESGGPEADYKFAVMERLQINDQGQIANWPQGFMDNDLKEANLWLTAMERRRSLDDDE